MKKLIVLFLLIFLAACNRRAVIDTGIKPISGIRIAEDVTRTDDDEKGVSCYLWRTTFGDPLWSCVYTGDKE